MAKHSGARWLALALTSAAALAFAALPAHATVATASEHPGTGLTTNYDFVQLVLRDGGWPVSASNVTVLTQWLRAEEPTSDWWDRDNPLNNGLGSGGGSGLGSYASVVTAAYDVARNLENTGYGYPKIVHDLATSAPAGVTAAAIWRSSWAAGHYGRGADWETTPVPSVAAPPSAWRSPTTCPVAYPAHVVGPCGRDFSTTGTTWHSGWPEGIERQELWTFSRRGGAQDTATWAPALAPGTYSVAAFLPVRFDDATVVYVVRDATGVHHVRIDQDPYNDAWASLGEYRATALVPVTVSLGNGSRLARGSTYVAVDAMRFLPIPGGSSLAASPAPLRTTLTPLRVPTAPEGVTAVSADGRAVVSWLAPSKDGGAPIRRFVVRSTPGDRTCVVGAAAGESSCALHGLTNGVTYRFSVQAANRAGLGAHSSPSNPVVPSGPTTVSVVARARALQFGARLVLRATVRPATDLGTVLFAEDGVVLPGCQAARVVLGHASCATRARVTGSHVILVTYTGSAAQAGTESTLGLRIVRAPAPFRASAVPGSVATGAVLVLRADGLPGPALGRIDFAVGATRLCAASVRSGGASCRFRLHLLPGWYSVRATYVGDRDFAATVAHAALHVLAASS